VGSHPLLLLLPLPPLRLLLLLLLLRHSELRGRCRRRNSGTAVVGKSQARLRPTRIWRTRQGQPHPCAEGRLSSAVSGIRCRLQRRLALCGMAALAVAQLMKDDRQGRAGAREREAKPRLWARRRRVETVQPTHCVAPTAHRTSNSLCRGQLHALACQQPRCRGAPERPSQQRGRQAAKGQGACQCVVGPASGEAQIPGSAGDTCTCTRAAATAGCAAAETAWQQAFPTAHASSISSHTEST
jgi:hypothetical protein